MDKEAKDFSRRQDYLHPSELSHGDWCPLASYLRIKNLREGGTFTKEAFGFQSLNIFQHGHEVHHKWQTWLGDMGLLWGGWFCRNCHLEWQGMARKTCLECNSRHLEYTEIRLDAEKQLLIAGSADGGVPMHKALLEFKTVGAGTVRIEEPDLLKEHTHKTTSGKNLVDYEGLWRGITRPFSSHQRQGQLYLYICKLLGLDFDKVIYIYESKFTQGTKEFVVKRRESIIEDVLDQADQIKRALNFGETPPKCPKGGCKHCDPKKENTSDGEESPSRLRRRAAERGTEGRTEGSGARIGTRRAASRRRTEAIRRPD